MRIRYSTDENGRLEKKASVYTKNEHRIIKESVDVDALRVVERLKSSGHETYIVGGAVRDLLVGKTPKDFDIVTDASPTRIKRLFRNSRIIGRRFRLVHVFFGTKIFEVSTFRSLKDGTTSNTYGSIDEDVLRRDFTLNALFYDPEEEIIVDYVGGVQDIRAKRVKPVIPLSIIFKDDPVRMLRAAKYAAITGFKLPLTLRWKIKRQAALLAPISPSRLTEELFKIIHSTRAASIVATLDELGLYTYLQPNAVARMKSDPTYKLGYMASLAELDAVALRRLEMPSGRSLSFFIRDYLDSIVDWNAEPLESYRSALASCRSFVLPMNPPRIELENAVRFLFREHGIAIKKARTFEKGQRREGLPEHERGTGKMDQNFPGEGDAIVPSPAKKRRRRRRRKNSEAAVVGSDPMKVETNPNSGTVMK